jgi:hypothetical protein
MGADSSANRRCIFCDNPVDSGEHFWPRWARRILKRPGHIRRTEIAVNYPAKAAPFGSISYWTSNGPTYAKKIHVVCQTCNNDWMNQRHEIPNRIFLEPMMKGGDPVSRRGGAAFYRGMGCA